MAAGTAEKVIVTLEKRKRKGDYEEEAASRSAKIRFHR